MNMLVLVNMCGKTQMKSWEGKWLNLGHRGPLLHGVGK